MLKMENKLNKNGSVLILVVVAMMIMSVFGAGMLAIAYGTRQQAIKQKNETAALLAAEAGYEKAVFWMSQQQDMLTTLYNGSPGTTGTLNFTGADCDYTINFYAFIKARPVYRIVSNGHSGMFNRTVDTLVMQAISGWAMGKCRVPTGSSSTSAVNYVDGEIIDMPLQINKLLGESSDEKDIYIIGNPQFLQPVAMGESRYTTGGSDKYSTVMGLFQQGIYFNQPDSRVVDEATVQSKVNRFRDSTAAAYRFTPTAVASVTNGMPAVHLEFFVDANNIGKVRITNNCTVKGYKQSSDGRTYDFKIVPGSGGANYQRYNIYSYHLMPQNADSTGERVIRQIDQTYVTQSFGGVESQPGGQIFVNGNVIIGSSDPALSGTLNKVKEKITVVATGNIWIANSLEVDGAHNADGKPSGSNQNVLGLISQSVIKVVDPGMSRYSTGGTNNYPGPPTSVPSGTVYVPIGIHQSGSSNVYDRLLPHDMVVEAALTVGGGGWGAENVARGYYGGRREFINGQQDNLILRGAITEACRGVVGITGSDGYLKFYYLDSRLLEGVLPGDFWLQGKYIPAPAGWRDYRN
ncbi:MAG: hypothetical protein A2Y10_19770 [Planctomycetes bacterium GWF2_41_51]|nr:MAG: hypothetical protein A2Y10_19770 [Planctomycetes bacterium GWF2_41_51]HBG28336.1 hypothetical protein [Phycisphaerales bacterium]